MSLAVAIGAMTHIPNGRMHAPDSFRNLVVPYMPDGFSVPLLWVAVPLSAWRGQESGVAGCSGCGLGRSAGIGSRC